MDGADQAWAMGVVSVALADGRTARVLAVLVVLTREALARRADARFTADVVAAVREGLKSRRGVPRNRRVDNGPEFAGGSLDLWAHGRGSALGFSRPGQPTGNAFVESFSGRLRDECPSPRWLLCLDELRAEIARRRPAYNRERPRSALGALSPEAFASQEAGNTTPDQGPKLA